MTDNNVFYNGHNLNTVHQHTPTKTVALSDIEKLDRELLARFRDRVIVQPALTRKIVSFQANKSKPLYRWYKYKEAFSADLVDYLLHEYRVGHGKVLDPFAGAGTALFVAASVGMDADGIELLPIGQQIMGARRIVQTGFSSDDLVTVRCWADVLPWKLCQDRLPITELRITQGAYPVETRAAIEQYLAAIQTENDRVRHVLRFALLCVLEAISFTRKDGQYLRWDYRSGRRLGKNDFNKGHILNFDQAICTKLHEIVQDLDGFDRQLELPLLDQAEGTVHVYDGSCLDIMPAMPEEKYDAIITSPPYCNRYDYTRTYALELALLGVGEKELVNLRQYMLSCTVENREKDLVAMNPAWHAAVSAATRTDVLQAILMYLDGQREQGVLNNTGIPRMVRGYFYEMACIIQECARVLKPNATMFMVNDNVRYAGASVSVDLILSEIAEQLGFRCERILVLPNGKGNSSQQMGEHGREPLRKCVYIWRKC